MLAGDRHALVIGIDRCTNVTPLLKARNEAEAVSAALDRLDFHVTTTLDPGRRDINQALSIFAARLQPGDEALFHFAGHGIEVSGRNYLLPVDVPAPHPATRISSSARPSAPTACWPPCSGAACGSAC